MTEQEALTNAVAGARRGRPAEWHDIDGGARVRVTIESDSDHNMEEDGDWFGSLHWPDRRDTRQRPAGCDGAARKIDSRSGPLWWQPPADVTGDPEALAALEARVRGYFLEHWSYVGVKLEYEAAPCAVCGERKMTHASLWAIESDAGDYFDDVARNLLAHCQEELPPGPPVASVIEGRADTVYVAFSNDGKHIRFWSSDRDAADRFTAAAGVPHFRYKNVEELR